MEPTTNRSPATSAPGYMSPGILSGVVAGIVGAEAAMMVAAGAAMVVAPVMMVVAAVVMMVAATQAPGTWGLLDAAH